jgi:hypothetical protein
MVEQAGPAVAVPMPATLGAVFARKAVVDVPMSMTVAGMKHEGF